MVGWVGWLLEGWLGVWLVDGRAGFFRLSGWEGKGWEGKGRERLLLSLLWDDSLMEDWWVGGWVGRVPVALCLMVG